MTAVPPVVEIFGRGRNVEVLGGFVQLELGKARIFDYVSPRVKAHALEGSVMLSVNVCHIRILSSLSTRWYKERDATDLCPVTAIICTLQYELSAGTVATVARTECKIRDLVNIKEREVSEASFNYDFDNLAHQEVSFENSQTTAKADFRNDSPTIPNELPTNSQNAELIKIIHNKEIENTKLRNEREECRGSKQTLQAQVSRLFSDLKLANQTITGLEDDINILSKQLAGKNETKNAVSHTPKPKRKLRQAHASFNSGTILSSTPASSAVTTK
ncbi:unnamed protein product [Mytilus coruscus]|uniref:Uncharacterized protein n=1 Tax=Mytilus coruscus TaxID=42192 RepID=A0A6J8B0S0_MYTCO|nr:unnamed protein product [Mytilus coruscus]